MRLLFLTCQPPHHMAPPRLADEQINCGPWFIDQKIGDSWVTRNTPYGDYDVAPLARELAATQPPDLVVCHVDCGFGLKPKNLGVFKCPVVLIAADSHWGAKAISSMVAYAVSEPFTRIVTVYDRHHIGFYRAAGLKNVHWFPALTFAHDDARVHAAEGQKRGPSLALVGKVGYHARRQRMFAALIAAKIPLAWRETRQSEVIAHYGRSLLGLNVAMNGDLNLRVFEIIAGGAMLLTDKLAQAAGLDDLLAEGREKVSYATPAELIEKARHYLANPAAAAEIGNAGKRWFDEHFHEQRRRRAFCELALEGRDLPEFAVAASATVFDLGAASLTGVLAAYDTVNELHRHQERVGVRIEATVPAGVSGMFATLPRVRVLGPVEPWPADLVVLDAGKKPIPGQLRARHAWCWNAAKSDMPSLRTAFAQARWTAEHEPDVVFAAAKPPANPSEAKVAEAQRCLASADFKRALDLCREALTANPRGADACLIMAEVAALTTAVDTMRSMVANARRAEPENPRIVLFEWAVANGRLPTKTQRYLATALKAYESLQFTVAIHYANLVLAEEPANADAWQVIAFSHAQLARVAPSAEIHHREFLEALFHGAEAAPDRGELKIALGIALLAAEAWEEAQWILEQASQQTREPWALVGLATARHHAGTVHEAPSTAAAALLTTARVHQRLGRTEFARSRARAAIAAFPDCAAAHAFSATLALEPGGDPAAALESAKASLDLLPDDPATNRLYGRALIEAGLVAEGVGVLRHVAREAPGDIEGWLAFGTGLMRRQRWGEAIDALLQAAAIKPTDARVREAMAEAGRRIGHFSIADLACGRADANGVRAVPIATGAREPRDLIICHLEINQRQGSGVFLRRLFPDSDGFVTLRSRTCYDGEVQFGGTHLALDMPGLSIAERKRRIGLLLAPYEIRRILCVPFFKEDFIHGILAQEITGAPLCAYPMDDQTAFASEVPTDLAAQLFRCARLRLTISPEMRDEYGTRFGLEFGMLPPVLDSQSGHMSNRWTPQVCPADRGIMVGNVWSAEQFRRIRALTREAGLQIDWFGHGTHPTWADFIPQKLAEEGIHLRGYVSEEKLVEELANHPFLLVPSGMLDGSDRADEWLTRLSIPSKMIHALVMTHTPMLVLGDHRTAAARLATRLGAGMAAVYESGAVREGIDSICLNSSRTRLIANARRVAQAFVMPAAGNWIWDSLSDGTPRPAPFDRLLGIAPAEAEAIAFTVINGS